MCKLGVLEQIKFHGKFKIWTFFILSRNTYFKIRLINLNVSPILNFLYFLANLLKYKIKHTFQIVPNVWTIHHSEKEFDDPFVFKPERFLDDKGQLLPSNDPVRKRCGICFFFAPMPSPATLPFPRAKSKIVIEIKSQTIHKS